MTLQSGGLILNTDGFRMAGGIGAGTCGVRPRWRLFSLVHGTVPGRNLCILNWAKYCIETNYTGE
jgi:hypothetical protein